MFLILHLILALVSILILKTLYDKHISVRDGWWKSAVIIHWINAVFNGFMVFVYLLVYLT